MTRRSEPVTYAIAGKRWANLNGSHRNPHAHQALMNEWKGLTILAVMAGSTLPRFEGRVQLTATVRRTRNGRSDAHNVTPTIKACIDGLVSCAVIPDDHDGIVRRLIIEAGPKAKVPTVELTVEAAP